MPPLVLVLDEGGIGPFRHRESNSVFAGPEIRTDVKIRSEAAILCHADKVVVDEDLQEVFESTDAYDCASLGPVDWNHELALVDACWVGCRRSGRKVIERHLHIRVLREIVETVWPTKMVLLTTAMFRDSQREVNESIRRMREEYDNVTVLNWGDIAKTPGVIAQDGVHLSADGRAVLATAVARALEFAPDRTNGKCLDSRFTDDSEVLDDEDVTTETSLVDTTETTAVPATTISPAVTTVTETTQP